MNKFDYKDIDDTLSPYVKVILDCYQNCILTLLNYLGCNVALLGSQWPWGFHVRGDLFESPYIRNTYMVDSDNIRKLYGLSITREQINTSEHNAFEQIIETLQSCPVIINLDQYMVSHHYKHIFNKQHGPHSLLLYGYDEEKESFTCVDSIPEYKGLISKELVLSGVFSYPEEAGGKSTLTYIKNGQISKQSDYAQIFNNFLLEPHLDNECLTIESLCKLINSQLDALSSEHFFNWAALLCRGTWIWEIDRNALLTIEYLQFINELGYINADVINEIRSLNTRLNVIIKKFYKMVISCKITAMEAILDELNILVDLEIKIKGRLSFAKGENNDLPNVHYL